MSPLIGATVTKTVNFGTFGFLLSSLRDKGAERASDAQIVLAGAASAVVASVVLTPVDRAKILLQVQRSREERLRAGLVAAPSETAAERLYHGPIDVWRDQGMRGMWRGQGVTALREIVYGSLYFFVFERLKVCLFVSLLLCMLISVPSLGRRCCWARRSSRRWRRARRRCCCLFGCFCCVSFFLVVC